MKLDDIKLGGKLMVLLVGPTGLGKSNLAASFAQIGPCKFYDFDGRMQGVKGYSGTKPYASNIEFETYGPAFQPGKTKSIPQFKAEIEALQDKCPYKTIVVDSITSLSITLINYQLLAKGSKGKSVAGGLPVTTWDEVNGETVVFSELLDILKMVPCHVIFTAHPIEKTVIEGDKSVKHTTITAYGHKVPQIVPNYFNEYWTLQKEVNPKGVMRVLYTQPTPEITAKTALPLPSKIDVTNNPDIYGTIQKILSDAGISLDPNVVTL